MTFCSRLVVLLSVAAAALCPVAAAQAQAPAAVGAKASPAKASAATLPNSEDLRRFTNSDIAKRPYSAAFPAPLYPASPRQQKQFTVEYLYNYAQSEFTPPAALPQVARVAANRDTPEGAMAAFYSAMRAGDYQAWLDCFDPPSRKAIEAETKADPRGAEKWRAAWRESFAGRRIVLVDRIETVNYVLFNVRIDEPGKPGAPVGDQETLVPSTGKWFVTNALAFDGLLMNLQPGKDKEVKQYGLLPAAELVGPARLSGEAQKEFLTRHLTTNLVRKTVE